MIHLDELACVTLFVMNGKSPSMYGFREETFFCMKFFNSFICVSECMHGACRHCRRVCLVRSLAKTLVCCLSV